MKRTLLAALLCVPAILFAGEAPAPIKGYLPTDHFVKAANVKVAPSDNFPVASKPLQDAIKKLMAENPEALKEIQAKGKPEEPIPFDERLGISKEDYDKYIAAWNERKLVPVEEVAARFKDAGDGKWEIAAVSITNNTPLPMSCLTYDSKEDVWTSPNGKLARKDDLKLGKMNLLGELSGPQWIFEDKNSFGATLEKLALAKSADGKDLFLIYQLIEVAANGQPTYQNLYVIRVDAKDMKVDPLKQQAAQRAAAKDDKKKK